MCMQILYAPVCKYCMSVLMCECGLCQHIVLCAFVKIMCSCVYIYIYIHIYIYIYIYVCVCIYIVRITPYINEFFNRKPV